MPFPTVVAAPLLAVAASLPAAPTAASASAAWPVPRPVVLAPYSAPADPFAAGHRGVDLAAYPGEPVTAPLAGRVAFAGMVAGTPVVTLDHGSGLRTTYQPVAAGPPAGTRVRPGQVIGLVASGAAHCGQLPTCLHWGARRGDSYLDPLVLVAGSHPVLLPLDPAVPAGTPDSGTPDAGTGGLDSRTPDAGSGGLDAESQVRVRPKLGYGSGAAAVAATGTSALLLLGAGAAFGRRRLLSRPGPPTAARAAAAPPSCASGRSGSR